jgi:hypothetical protein
MQADVAIACAELTSKMARLRELPDSGPLMPHHAANIFMSSRIKRYPRAGMRCAVTVLSFTWEVSLVMKVTASSQNVNAAGWSSDSGSRDTEQQDIHAGHPVGGQEPPIIV